LVILPASSYLRPRLTHRRVNGLIRGLAFTTSGLVVATSLDLLISSGGADGPALWQLALAALAFAVGLEGKRHPIFIVLFGGLVGLVVAR
jgi:chromate transport protein ChrA